MTRTMAAEVVFTEDPQGGRWIARLLAPDRATGLRLGRPIGTSGYILTISEVEDTRWDGRPYTEYRWTTPGTTHPGGNRHEQADTLSEAQDRVTRWASRRFRTEVSA